MTLSIEEEGRPGKGRRVIKKKERRVQPAPAGRCNKNKSSPISPFLLGEPAVGVCQYSSQMRRTDKNKQD